MIWHLRQGWKILVAIIGSKGSGVLFFSAKKKRRCQAKHGHPERACPDSHMIGEGRGQGERCSARTHLVPRRVNSLDGHSTSLPGTDS